MPINCTASKAASEATKGRTTSKSKASRQISTSPANKKESRNPAPKGASKAHHSRKGENPENTMESSVLNADVSIDDMAKEVMALVLKSKERRKQNVFGDRRRTCYSTVPQKRGKSEVLSPPFEYSVEEEADNGDADRGSQAANAPAKPSARLVTRTRQMPTRKPLLIVVETDEEIEDEQSGLPLRAVQPTNATQQTGAAGTRVAGGRKTAPPCIISRDDDEDFEEREQQGRKRKSRSRTLSDRLSTLQNASSSKNTQGAKTRHRAERCNKKRKVSSTSVSDSEEQEVEVKRNVGKRGTRGSTRYPTRQSSKGDNRGKGNDGEKNDRAHRFGLRSSSTNVRSLRKGSSESVEGDEAAGHSAAALDHSDSSFSISISDFEEEGEAKRHAGTRSTQSSRGGSQQSRRGKRGGRNAQPGDVRRKEPVQKEASAASADEGEPRPWNEEEIKRLDEYGLFSISLFLSLFVSPMI